MVLVPVLPWLQEQNRSWVPPEVTMQPQLCCDTAGSWSCNARQQRFWVAEKSGMLLGRGSYW